MTWTNHIRILMSFVWFGGTQILVIDDDVNQSEFEYYVSFSPLFYFILIRMEIASLSMTWMNLIGSNYHRQMELYIDAS